MSDKPMTPDEVAAAFNGEWVTDAPAEGWHPPADVREFDAGEQQRMLAAALPEPAPSITSPRSVAEALDATVELLERFVAFANPAQVVAVALWVAHTYWKNDLETTPYLAILSAEKRSGKSRLLDVLELVVADPWRITFPSAAVLFRQIEAVRPTLLLDEVDAIFGRKASPAEDLRGLFNDGHRLGGKVARMEAKGRGFEMREYSTFCPKAFAGIGWLPDTVMDRAIAIRMQRRRRDQPVARFRRKTMELETLPLREAFEVFSLNLLRSEPPVPVELNDRLAEGWEPLLAVADMAGGEWPKVARAAAVFLAAEVTDDDESLGVRLLSDIRRVFDFQDVDRFPTAQLLDHLHAMEEAPWGDLRGRPLSAHGLSRLLRPFDVHPKTIRVGDITPKGYLREAFEDAFSRYLADETATPQQANNDGPKRVADDISGKPNRNAFEPITTGDVAVLRFETENRGEDA